MIQLPRRSVTRFFIPLVDVMMLLFCIFLLMPMVQPGEGFSGDQGLKDANENARLKREVERLKNEGKDRLHALQEELARLRREKGHVLQQRLAFRVLEIDSTSGKLFYYDPDRTEIRNQIDAEALIDRDRRDRAGDTKELFYLVILPRDPNSDFPRRPQQKKYADWFKDVTVFYDTPGASPAAGKQP